MVEGCGERRMSSKSDKPKAEKKTAARRCGSRKKKA